VRVSCLDVIGADLIIDICDSFLVDMAFMVEMMKNKEKQLKIEDRKKR
jgi:hypothetical protein